LFFIFGGVFFFFRFPCESRTFGDSSAHQPITFPGAHKPSIRNGAKTNQPTIHSLQFMDIWEYGISVKHFITPILGNI
jgi:hypothetical protein